MDGLYSGPLQFDKRPPGSKYKNGGLNPSPLGTRLGLNFENFALYQVFSNPTQTLGFQGYGLGFASGKWAPEPWAGQWVIPFYTGRAWYTYHKSGTSTTETPKRQPAPLVARRTTRHRLTL